MTGFITVREGQGVAVWNKKGEVRYVKGPRRMWLFQERVETLYRYSAEAHEYLVIRYQNGVAEHVRGPAELWHDPVKHAEVEVKTLVPVDANEALVVYKRGDEGEVSRRVLRGPAQYMPEPDEWLHQFRWHGADKKNPAKKIPHALQFTKLRVIPDQMYVDVPEVRTADDALLTVLVMIFFELADIERMLDQTHDPVADFMNAITADVIDFAATRPFELFKRDTEALNDLKTYPHLTARAQRIGYRVNKVVYRGYDANPKLQAMHDHAIEKRTALQLEAETESQAQELADLKLTKEAERARQHQEMETERVQHEQAIQRMTHDEALREQAEEHRQALQFKQEVNQIELEHIRAKNEEEKAMMQNLQGLDVDMTRYLVAQYQHPDRLIRIDGAMDGAQVHLHQEGEL